MRIVVIGTGYVGLVSGACFSEVGNCVTCIDIDKSKIENLKKGIIPIYEPGLEDMVHRCYERGDLRFSTSLEESIGEAELVFIAVGTPMGDDGSADLSFVLNVASEIGKTMSSELVIVDKSTVPVGTANKVKLKIQEELKKRGAVIDFHIVSNPEFLKEGDAVKDFMRPDRIVIGAEDEIAISAMRTLYAPFTVNHDRFISMDVRSAELTKYASNCFLATKISFMNEIANLCELLGADANKIRAGIGSDSRIGNSFIYPGAGYGGSCFPKDVHALIKTAEDSEYEPRILKAVNNVNNDQKMVLGKKIVAKYGKDLSGYKFAIWGLTFKPNTDDMREAPSIFLIKELVERGAEVVAYDPKGQKEAEAFYLKDLVGLSYASSKYRALEEADALILVTEWKEFRSPDFDEMEKLLKSKVLFDGRNQFNSEDLAERGWFYSYIGCPGELS